MRRLKARFLVTIAGCKHDGCYQKNYAQRRQFGQTRKRAFSDSSKPIRVQAPVAPDDVLFRDKHVSGNAQRCKGRQKVKSPGWQIADSVGEQNAVNVSIDKKCADTLAMLDEQRSQLGHARKRGVGNCADVVVVQPSDELQ